MAYAETTSVAFEKSVAEAKAEALRQFPYLPISKPVNWESCAAAVVEIYGEIVDVEPGHLVRTTGPIETLRQVAPHADVIVVETDGGDHG